MMILPLTKKERFVLWMVALKALVRHSGPSIWVGDEDVTDLVHYLRNRDMVSYDDDHVAEMTEKGRKYL